MYALSAAMFRWVSQLSQAWMERNERWRCKRPAFLSEGTAAAVRPLWFFFAPAGLASTDVTEPAAAIASTVMSVKTADLRMGAPPPLRLCRRIHKSILLRRWKCVEARARRRGRRAVAGSIPDARFGKAIAAHRQVSMTSRRTQYPTASAPRVLLSAAPTNPWGALQY